MLNTQTILEDWRKAQATPSLFANLPHDLIIDIVRKEQRRVDIEDNTTKFNKVMKQLNTSVYDAVEHELWGSDVSENPLLDCDDPECYMRWWEVEFRCLAPTEFCGLMTVEEDRLWEYPDDITLTH